MQKHKAFIITYSGVFALLHTLQKTMTIKVVHDNQFLLLCFYMYFSDPDVHSIFFLFCIDLKFSLTYSMPIGVLDEDTCICKLCL